MKAKYQLVRTPDFNNSPETQPLHPRLVSHKTVSITELMRHAKNYSSLSTADMKAALQLIAELLEDNLRHGFQVELDGIGYFSVSLKSRPVMEKEEIRSPSIHFKQVNFRLNKEMKIRLRGMELERDPEQRKEPFSPQEREQRLWNYLNRHPSISTSIYMALNRCTRYLALKDLNHWLEEEKLTEAGHRNTRIYLKK